MAQARVAPHMARFSTTHDEKKRGTMTKAIMIQGTASNVGKSLITTGLARAFTKRGLAVAPFKPQTLANNAAVTCDGGEIGRAQALQARACGLDPHSDMNPVLLKPQGNGGMQMILQGQRIDAAQKPRFTRTSPHLMQAVMDSFRRVCATADLVLVEGAGSPAESNLRQGDIANMGFAEAAGLPVILTGDIECGGVIAQLVGTKTVLSSADAARVQAFAINKFHGDPGHFADGLTDIQKHTGWPSLGVIPWFPEAWRLPAEDVMDLRPANGGPCRIAVPHLPNIANFDDLDPLAPEPDITVDIIAPGHPLPGDAALVLLPGSKSTIADLAAVRANGWDIDLAAHIRRGGHVLGLCGGYQMLGREISDPEGIEGLPSCVAGLGHLNVTTVMRPKKHVSRTQATVIPSGESLTGYEIHIGETEGPDCARAWLKIGARLDGAANETGRVRGCYLHGLFTADAFRANYLTTLGGSSRVTFEAAIEDTLDALAHHLEAHLDLDRILSLAKRPRFSEP